MKTQTSSTHTMRAGSTRSSRSVERGPHHRHRLGPDDERGQSSGARAFPWPAWIAFAALGAAALLATDCSGTGPSRPATESPSSLRSTLASSSESPAGSTQTPGTSAGLGATTEDSLPPSDPRIVKLAWREGVSLYSAGDYKDASTRLQVAAAGRPNDAYAHYLLGLALHKSGQSGEAEKALELAATLNPDSARTWINLARVRMDLNHPDRALEAADTALG